MFPKTYDCSLTCPTTSLKQRVLRSRGAVLLSTPQVFRRQLCQLRVLAHIQRMFLVFRTSCEGCLPCRNKESLQLSRLDNSSLEKWVDLAEEANSAAAEVP